MLQFVAVKAACFLASCFFAKIIGIYMCTCVFVCVHKTYIDILLQYDYNANYGHWSYISQNICVHMFSKDIVGVESNKDIVKGRVW